MAAVIVTPRAGIWRTRSRTTASEAIVPARQLFDTPASLTAFAADYVQPRHLGLEFSFHTCDFRNISLASRDAPCHGQTEKKQRRPRHKTSTGATTICVVSANPAGPFYGARRTNLPFS